MTQISETCFKIGDTVHVKPYIPMWLLLDVAPSALFGGCKILAVRQGTLLLSSRFTNGVVYSLQASDGFVFEVSECDIVNNRIN